MLDLGADGGIGCRKMMETFHHPVWTLGRHDAQCCSQRRQRPMFISYCLAGQERYAGLLLLPGLAGLVLPEGRLLVSTHLADDSLEIGRRPWCSGLLAIQILLVGKRGACPALPLLQSVADFDRRHPD